MYTANVDGGNTLTISSLHGDYIHVVVQVTRDLHPVIYSDWLLPGLEFDIGVADVTLEQFEALAESLGRSGIETAGMHASARAEVLSLSMVSLDNLLKVSRLYPMCKPES